MRKHCILFPAFLLFAFVALVSCGKGNKYNVEGVVEVDDYDSLMAYLLDYKAEVIDSSLILDNHFYFSGEVEEPELVTLVCGYASGQFALEPGDIQLNVTLQDILPMGTPTNDEINVFKGQLAAKAEEAMGKLTLLQSMQEEDSSSNLSFDSLIYEINNNYVKDITSLLDSVYNANPDNLLGLYVYILKLWNIDSLPEAEAMVAEASPFIAKNPYVTQYLEYLTQVDSPQIGGLNGVDDNQLFIDFEGKTSDGKTARLSDYVGKGKPVLVDFWASWCGPCRAETPTLKKVADQYKDKLVVLGIAVSDEVKNHLAAVEELGITWPQILDSKGEAAEAYNVQTIPFIILFAPDGTVYKQNLRGEQIEAAVSELIQ